MLAPHQCPLCQSDEIEGRAIEIEDDCAKQPMVCLECHSTWTNGFLFQYPEDLAPPDLPDTLQVLASRIETIRTALHTLRESELSQDDLEWALHAPHWGPVEQEALEREPQRRLHRNH